MPEGLFFTVAVGRRTGKESGRVRNQRVRSKAVTRGKGLTERDAAGVAAEVLQFHANLWPGGLQREAFGPLQDGHGRSQEHVFHAEGLEIVEILDAVEVGVEDLG